MSVTARNPTLKLVLGAVVLAVLVVGWYLFRPELLFISKTVNEEPPKAAPATSAVPSSPGPRIVAQGKFRGLAHETKGVAAIYRLPDGKRVLRLTEFETSNGPDVHVYLVRAADANDNAAVKKAGFVDLGSMKGNRGDQNYDVPVDIDLSTHRSVSIWCARFSVNFGVAPLMPERG